MPIPNWESATLDLDIGNNGNISTPRRGGGAPVGEEFSASMEGIICQWGSKRLPVTEKSIASDGVSDWY